MADHFDWLCESPFCATRRTRVGERRLSGDFELEVEYLNASASMKLAIGGFQMEFSFSVSSVEYPRPNEWSSTLWNPEWDEFEGVESDSYLDVRTEAHLQSICSVLSNLCRRYPEYFLPGNFLLIQNKMMAMINARKEHQDNN